jgi:flagellar motor component MotA
MTRDEFIEKYYDIAGRALTFSEKARREGLLALENKLDQEKIDERDVFEYGIRFAVDGDDKEIIEKILSNIIEQEKDEYVHSLKTIQKEAVLMIQGGVSPRSLYAVLNSYTDITLKEDKIKDLLENEAGMRLFREYGG